MSRLCLLVYEFCDGVLDEDDHAAFVDHTQQCRPCKAAIVADDAEDLAHFKDCAVCSAPEATKSAEKVAQCRQQRRQARRQQSLTVGLMEPAERNRP